jgi:hypothetical protein
MPAAGEIIDTKTAVLIQFLKGRRSNAIARVFKDCRKGTGGYRETWFIGPSLNLAPARSRSNNTYPKVRLRLHWRDNMIGYKKAVPERSKININQPAEVKFWTRRLGVPKEEHRQKNNSDQNYDGDGFRGRHSVA